MYTDKIKGANTASEALYSIPDEKGRVIAVLDKNRLGILGNNSSASSNVSTIAIIEEEEDVAFAFDIDMVKLLK